MSSRERSTNAPRDWHPGNCGPDYHCESMRKKRHGNLWDRPKAVDWNGGAVAASKRHGILSQGRDPHDKVTLELPLEEPEVVVRLNPILRAVRVALEEGKDAVAWLLLMEWAGMPIGIEECCNASR